MKKKCIVLMVSLVVCFVFLSYTWNFLPGNFLAYLPSKYDYQTINTIYFAKKSKIIQIENEDPIQKIHRNWCDKNKNGWNVDINTFVPGIIIVSGEIRFNVITESETVVADFPVLGGGRTQLVKTIGKDDLKSYLKEFNRIKSEYFNE